MVPRSRSVARWCLVSQRPPVAAGSAATELSSEQDYLADGARAARRGCASRPSPSRCRAATRSRPSTWRAPCTVRAASLDRRPVHRALLRPDRHRRGRALVHRPAPRGRRAAATRWSSTGGPTISRAVLPGQPADPMGVVRRRRFGIEPGRHHRLRGRAPHRPAPRRERAQPRSSPREIERPRVGPMRDIVATIQPEQDEIVRADVDTTVCVQGAPGTGKTAVGLHRAAWLLYAYRDRLAPRGRARRRAEPRLPRAHRRRAARARRGRGRAHDRRGPGRRPVPVRGSGRPGDGRAQGRRADGRGAAPGGRGRTSATADRAARRCRAGRAALAGAGARGRRDRRRAARAGRPVRRGPGRCCPSGWPTRSCVQMEARRATPRTTGCRTRVARSRAVRRYADAALAGGRPARRAAVGCSATPASWPRARRRPARPPRSRRCCCWPTPPRGPRQRALVAPPTPCCSTSCADLVERTPSLGHVVLDEAQDLSPMQLRAVGRRCSTGLGDGARRHRPGHHAVGDAVVGGGAGPPRASPTGPRRGAGPRLPGAGRGDRLRRPAAARRSRRSSGRPTSVRDDPGSLEIRRIDRDGGPVAGRRVAAVGEALRREGSVGVIVPDAWTAAPPQRCGVRRDRARGPRRSTRSTETRTASVAVVPGDAWPRAWSSTTSWWSSRPPSSPPSPTRGPGCAGSTSS